MSRAIIYCRVSTEEQAETGHHSLAAQEHLCRKRAKEAGLEVARVYLDPGRSATNVNRPGLQDALARCEADRTIMALLVQDTDRLARNTQDHLAIRAMLKKHSVKLISVSQPMLEDSAEGNMIDTIIASVNQFQSDITARKTMKGMEEKARKGGWPGIAPLGYRNISTGSDGQTRIVEQDPSTAPLMKRMFELYATGNYSGRDLAEQMYALGLRSRSGKKLQISKVFTILTNSFYVGEVRRGNIATPGTHRPLIDGKLFAAVKQVLETHRGIGSRKCRHNFLLSGYIFCSYCGGRMLGETHSAKHVSYYRCHKYGGCQRVIRTQEAESQVVNYFESLHIPQELIKATVSEIEGRTSKERSAYQKVLSSLTNQKNVLIGKLSTVESKWLEKVIDDSDYVRFRDDLKAQIGAVSNKIGDLYLQHQSPSPKLNEVIAFAHQLGHVFRISSSVAQRLLLKFAWERFEVKEGEIVKAQVSPFIAAILGRQSAVHGGGNHPSRSSFAPLVRVRSGRGPLARLNRTQKNKKVVSQNTFSSSTKSIADVLKDVGYINHLIALYGEIQNQLQTCAQDQP